jgi:hypothetical protein
MRVLQRKYLAPLLLSVAFVVSLATQLAPCDASAGGSAAECRPAPGHVCPFSGTNWD